MLKRSSTIIQNQTHSGDPTEEASLTHSSVSTPLVLSRPKPTSLEDYASYDFRITTLFGLNQTTFQQNRTNSFFFLQQNNFLFDYIIDLILLFNHEEQNLSEDMAPPQIDYNSPAVKNFITQLNTILNSLDQGFDEKTHDKFWQSVKQEDLATVYLTILLGKLVQMDTKALQTAAVNATNTNTNNASNNSATSTPTDKTDTNGNNEDDEYQVVSPREISFNTDELRFDAQEVWFFHFFTSFFL